MKIFVKTITLFVILLAISSFDKLYAQDHWSTSEGTQFKADISSLLKSCDNNFSDITGKLVDTTAGIMEYECSKKLINFEVFIVNISANVNRLSGIMSVDGDGDDMDEIGVLLGGIPGYTVDDSDDGEMELPDGVDRRLEAINASNSNFINVNLYVKQDSYISLVMGKRNK